MKELFAYEMTEVLSSLKEEVRQVNAQKMEGAAREIAVPEPVSAEPVKIIIAPVSVTYPQTSAPDVNGVKVHHELKPAELHLPEQVAKPFDEADFQQKLTLGVQRSTGAFPAEIRLPETAACKLPEKKACQPEKPEISLSDVQTVKAHPKQIQVEKTALKEVPVPSVSYVPSEVTAPVRPDILISAAERVQYQAAAVKCKAPKAPVLPDQPGRTVIADPVLAAPEQADVTLPQVHSAAVKEIHFSSQKIEVEMQAVPYAVYESAVVQVSAQNPDLPAVQRMSGVAQKAKCTVDSPSSYEIRTAYPAACQIQGVSCQVSGTAPNLPDVRKASAPEIRTRTVQKPDIQIPAVESARRQTVCIADVPCADLKLPQIPAWNVQELVEEIVNGKVS